MAHTEKRGISPERSTSRETGGLPKLVRREGVDVSARLHRQGAGDELDVVPLHVRDDHDAHLQERTTQTQITVIFQAKRRRGEKRVGGCGVNNPLKKKTLVCCHGQQRV